MKNIFSVLPEDFFKLLNSKYKYEYMDCVQLIFETYKSELSYGVNRETVLNTLENYFEDNSFNDMVFEDENQVFKDSRAKANKVIRVLKECKWIDYEQVENYSINVILFDYAATIIESFNKIIKDDDMEFQAEISQIYSLLNNKENYKKPYEYVLKKVNENTEALISGLKKLSVSIKKHMDMQTNEMSPRELLDHFFAYHGNIGSKAYYRMKTSENISFFRNSIIERLNEIMDNSNVLNFAVKGYCEVEQVEDEERALDDLIQMIINIKSSFYRLDDIIEEIDRKHNKYQQSAIMRAKFLLSTGSNLEGKLSQILNYLGEKFNVEEFLDLYDEVPDDILKVFDIFPQRYMDNESLKTIAVTKKLGNIDEIDQGFELSDEEREKYVRLWTNNNLNRFSRKNINIYVEELLKENERVLASTLPIVSKRDMIRIIFISLYGKSPVVCYKVLKKGTRLKINDFEFEDFEIVRK